ncbi:beta-galactosidase [Paraburkholderia sp. CNPSo 3274]|uniref:beta-galactosidase n=1 Tax=Paraburkholderia sp. CNPSo 3274 TaxID=2940932 RepID=UPI0020B89813|nr:beta-galactosidase [Paraburkholderia sp. CNPSo 3274]MCP3711842.1 beta-galactosidase [Paraburkholderia sp. CNPSo 3274]
MNLERSHTFSFSPNGEHFLLDGEPFQIRSGEMHPARIPREYWLHRIRMAKAMGMNCIALYIMWNYHEPRRGVFDFESGNRDIDAFIRLCQQEALWVLLRPGPYVCAEWDLGGLPAYLLSEADIRLRTDSANDARYMAAVARYIGELAARIKPLMIDAGGPILMLQIENEFGSYASNPAYLEELRQLWLRSGITGPFYTEDGLEQLERNRSTVTGGAIALSNGNAAQIATVRRAFPAVPAMAGEVYTGWLTHWGEPEFAGLNYDLSAILTAFMQLQLSFNLYVIHGGTSFGFYAGANVDESGNYQPDITSYDYGAPINEQGAATAKYMKYRDIIASYLAAPLPDIPDSIATLAGHALTPTLYASIWDNLPEALPRESSVDPQPFEHYGQTSGFMLYRQTLQAQPVGALDISGVHDYAAVFVGEHYAGGVSRARIPHGYAQRLRVTHRAPLALPTALAGAPGALEILVEGMGRVNFGPAIVDHKGLLEPVKMQYADGSVSLLEEWEVFLLPMDEAYIARLEERCTNPLKPGLFFKAHLVLIDVGDTWLDMSNWTKGVVWVNGHSLGRYWSIGPQKRLYCPAPWLTQGENEVLIFDLHQTGTKPVHLANSLY